MQLIVRDRKRGELVALAFILMLPLIGILSNTIGHDVSRRGRRGSPPPPIERSTTAALADQVAREAFSLAPSERYTAATRAGAEGRPAASAAALLALAATAVLLHTGAALAFRRLLAFPGSVSRRRSGGSPAAPARGAPGLSPARARWRSPRCGWCCMPRGRSTLLSPLVVSSRWRWCVARRRAVQQSRAEWHRLAAFGAFVSAATLPSP